MSVPVVVARLRRHGERAVRLAARALGAGAQLLARAALRHVRLQLRGGHAVRGVVGADGERRVALLALDEVALYAQRGHAVRRVVRARQPLVLHEYTLQYTHFYIKCFLRLSWSLKIGGNNSSSG